jgi:peptidoglycan lytic transglycosylase
VALEISIRKSRLATAIALLLLGAPAVPQDVPASQPKSISASKQTAKRAASKKNSPTEKTATPKKKGAPKKLTVKQSAAAARKAKAAEAARLKRMHRAFVVSADLKPMAQQLLETHSGAGYAAVERYARKHTTDTAGSLAWLVLGLAHSSDSGNQSAKAISAFKNAKPHAGELGDYVDYFLASVYRNNRSEKDVILALDGFGKRYPDSVFLRDAALMQANALLSTRAFEEAIDVLEGVRKPVRSDIELALGKAYAGNGDNAKALESFHKIYYEMPLSPEADEAGAQLHQLAPDDAYATRAVRKARADLLAKGKWYSQAIAEYQKLINEAGADSSASIQVALAHAEYKSGRIADVRTLLSALAIPQNEIDANAQRLYLLAEIARQDSDDASQQAFIDSMKQSAPQSGWLQEALLSAANKFLLRNELDKSIAQFDGVVERFPKGKHAASAHWKAAWLNYRLGNMAEAKRRFEEHIELYPTSPEVPNALYWRARLAEDDNEIGRARAYYLKLTDRFRNYYYANLARERLQALKTADPTEDPLLAKLGASTAPAQILEVSDDVANLRLQKSRLLTNAALYDYAIRELQAAASDPANNWTAGEIARLQIEQGKPYVAIETLKRALPAYFAVDMDSIPRPFLEILFPRPYWNDLKIHAAANKLDPYLMASLIRQESEFNPAAVSPANAYGLMQLLPSVGKQLAHEVKLRHFSTAMLLQPEANIKLGTRYFREVLDENGGTVEYALAAYNAGANRVTDWRSHGKYRDTQEFVESIPFTETREYVQAIMRNMDVYRKLYGND